MEMMEKVPRFEFRCPMRHVKENRSVSCGWKAVHRWDSTGWKDLQRHMHDVHGVPIEAFYYLMGEKGLSSGPPSDEALQGRTEALDWPGEAKAPGKGQGS